MQEVALGQLMWRPDEFWDSTLREFVNASRGLEKSHEARYREDWERSRWQAMALLSVHMKKGSKMKPQDLVEFPWETPAKRKRTKEEKLESINRL